MSIPSLETSTMGMLDWSESKIFFRQQILGRNLFARDNSSIQKKIIIPNTSNIKAEENLPICTFFHNH